MLMLSADTTSDPGGDDDAQSQANFQRTTGMHNSSNATSEHDSQRSQGVVSSGAHSRGKQVGDSLPSLPPKSSASLSRGGSAQMRQQPPPPQAPLSHPSVGWGGGAEHPIHGGLTSGTSSSSGSSSGGPMISTELHVDGRGGGQTTSTSGARLAGMVSETSDSGMSPLVTGGLSLTTDSGSSRLSSEVSSHDRSARMTGQQ
eukprot:gene16030-22168_t